MKSLAKVFILLSFFGGRGYADNVVPGSDSHAQVVSAPAGSDQKFNLINIAPPDSNGVSHNQFNKFDIPDVVFNNHKGFFGVSTELAGRLKANFFYR